MSFKNTTSPYTANGFTTDPPNGVITRFTTNLKVTGFIASTGSYGVSVQVFEGAGRAFFVLNRMYGAIGRIRFEYFTSDGTGVAGVDYTAVSGFVVWNEFDIDAKVIIIPLLRTAKITSDTFFFNLRPAPQIGFAIGAYIFLGGNLNPFPSSNYTQLTASWQITIVREGRGTLNFVGTPYSVQRPGGSTTVTLQVQRFNGFKGAVGCSFHTTDGTAVAGVAYTAQTGTLSWADGEGGTKNITITILSGGAGTQSFTVTIDTPTGGVSIGTIPTATVDIVAGAPPANPTAGGSIPNQLADVILPADPTNTLWWRKDTMDDSFVGYWRFNLMVNSILVNKIGTVIGFGPATDSFGGGTDFVDQTPFFDPLSRFKFQGHIVG